MTPANQQELLALAARCEAASGADRNLTIAVSDACDMETPHGDPLTSLDAAMTLVPEGWDWCAETFGEDGAHGKVWRHGWHDDTVIHSNAATPALALTAASLRALAQEAERG